MGLCVFSEKTDFGSPVERVFKSLTDTDFITALFPKRLGYKLRKRSARYLGSGCSVAFEVRFFGVPLRWVSYVNSFSVNRHFSYVWQKSPLQCWEHDFYFETLPGGTRITECILYRFPFGKLGEWFNKVYFHGFLNRIYRERTERLFQEFGTYTPVKNNSRPENNSRPDPRQQRPSGVRPRPA